MDQSGFQRNRDGARRAGSLLVALMFTSSGALAAGNLCVPGQSIACVGPGGCHGGQSCGADGSSYGACDCGGANRAAGKPKPATKPETTEHPKRAQTSGREASHAEPRAGTVGARPAHSEPVRTLRDDDDHVMKYGFHAAIEGPRRWFGVGPAIEVSRLLELSLELGYKAASEEETSGTARSSASISATTVLGRARFWLFRRHSLIFDGGLGVAAYRVRADGSDGFGNTMTYSRSGSPMLATAGVGYGYRSDGWFRIAVLIGGMVHSGQLESSTLTTTGLFNPADASNLQSSLDSISNELTDPAPYVEVSFGGLF